MAGWRNDDPEDITPKNGLPGESYRLLILNVKKCRILLAENEQAASFKEKTDGLNKCIRDMGFTVCAGASSQLPVPAARGRL